MKRGLNAGSGQRPFKTVDEWQWVNLDAEARWNPDVIGDWNDLSGFDADSFDCVVSHHSYEHVGCAEGVPFIRAANRILRPGGSLIIIVPDMRALCMRWLLGEISTQIFMTNVYGAYMGDDHDRHKWGYDYTTLTAELMTSAGAWRRLRSFDWRTIPGADIAARDWWMLGVEATK